MRPHPDDTLDGLTRLAPYSPTARVVLAQRLAHPLRLSRRGDHAAAQLVEQLGPIEAARWLRAVAEELEL